MLGLGGSVTDHKVTWKTHEGSSSMPDPKMEPRRAHGNATTVFSL